MIKRFFSDSAIYVIPNIVSRGLGFFLLPIYSRYLEPRDYGVLEFLGVVFAVLNLVLPLEISQAVARYMADAEREQKIKYASTAFWFTSIGFALFAAVVWLFPQDMAEVLLGDSEKTKIITVGSLAMFVNALFYLMQNHLRWTLQSKAFAKMSIIYSLVTSLVSIVLIVWFDMRVMGFVWGQLIGSMLALSGALYFTRNIVPIRISFNTMMLKEMIAFSTPLVFSSIAIYLTLYADRWILRELGTIDDVGIYSIAYRIAAVVSILIAAFQMALTPLVYQNYKDPQTPKNIGRIFSYFLLVVLPLILFVTLFSREITLLITTPVYIGAAELIPWLTLAVVLMNVYVFSPGLGIAKKTKFIALISTVAAVVNLSFNFLLIPEYGRMGAAVATLLSGFVVALMYFWLGNREYNVEYDRPRSGLAIIATITVMLVAAPMSLDLQAKVLLWVSTVILLVFILISSDDRQKVIAVLLRSQRV